MTPYQLHHLLHSGNNAAAFVSSISIADDDAVVIVGSEGTQVDRNLNDIDRPVCHENLPLLLRAR